MTAPTATRALTCAQCGAAFTCSSDAACWCAAEPYRLPMPEADAAGDCLCPACLRAKAAQAFQSRHRTVT